MNPDWIHALIGGAMIGTASGMLILGNGRIAGVSDILGALITRTKPHDWMERAAFLAGLLLVSLIWIARGGLPEASITSNVFLLIAGGLAVGVGTRMGSGCTSGHGVCGNARLSKRSIVATITFLVTGALTVAVVNLFL